MTEKASFEVHGSEHLDVDVGSYEQSVRYGAAQLRHAEGAEPSDRVEPPDNAGGPTVTLGLTVKQASAYAGAGWKVSSHVPVDPSGRYPRSLQSPFRFGGV